MYLKTAGFLMGSSVLIVVLIWGLYYSGYAPAFLLVGGEVESSQDKIMQIVLNANEPNNEAVIAKWYAPLIPIKVGNVDLFASIADTTAEREQGLSGTPYIPAEVVKLFVFEDSALWGFWMKDMFYPIDILWLDNDKKVIHIEQNVSPESYPQSFAPAETALYVVETKAGFVSDNNITIGAVVSW